MLFPWYATMMLTCEAGNVIGLRLLKLSAGGADAQRETDLMMSEKVDALFEASASLMAGGSASAIVDRYRQLVAANARRLALS